MTSAITPATRCSTGLLKEAERLLVRGGRLVLLSHELKLVQRLLQEEPSLRVLKQLRVWHGVPTRYLVAGEAVTAYCSCCRNERNLQLAEARLSRRCRRRTSQ